MSATQHRSQPDDELSALLEKRLIDEGISPERAEALAAALVAPESRVGALEIRDVAAYARARSTNPR